jgi:hypothetical protein
MRSVAKLRKLRSSISRLFPRFENPPFSFCFRCGQICLPGDARNNAKRCETLDVRTKVTDDARRTEGEEDEGEEQSAVFGACAVLRADAGRAERRRGKERGTGKGGHHLLLPDIFRVDDGHEGGR